MAPELLERGAAIVEHADMARRNDEGVIVAGQRLGMAAELVEHDAVIGKRRDIARLTRPRGPDQFFGFGIAALLMSQHAEEMQGIEMLRIRG
jgi:hypothetical protein